MDIKRISALCLTALSLFACSSPEEGTPREARISALRAQLEARGVEPLLAPPAPKTEAERAKVELGRMIFFDPELSDQRDASCSTCHRPAQATVDGTSLPAGTGARVDHSIAQNARIPYENLTYVPRNVPDLFNRGLPGFERIFWDTRLQRIKTDDGESFFALFDQLDEYNPAGILQVMPEGLDGPLAAQNMLPVLNRQELRGSSRIGPNGEIPRELATVEDSSLAFEVVWGRATERLLAIPGYVELFARAYPEADTSEIGFVHVANATAAFITAEFTLLDSPWDRFVAGDDMALGDAALRGAELFYGKAQCASCHSGALLTDFEAHNIAVVPLGPGPNLSSSRFAQDRGVAHRSHAGPEQSFAFRTPPLRNVELTAPYMHNGTYYSLRDVIAHKNDLGAAVRDYDPARAGVRPDHYAGVAALTVRGEDGSERPGPRFEVLKNPSPILASPLGLSEAEIDDLVAFLRALTDPRARDLTHVIPEAVPSGLPIEIPPPEAGAPSMDPVAE